MGARELTGLHDRISLGKEELAWMKPDAILVNVARGAILDEEVLYTHVKSHPAFLVGIDAWWTEPFLHGTFRMEYPFLDLPNVLGSPHNSAIVANALEYAARQAAENVKHFLRGGEGDRNSTTRRLPVKGGYDDKEISREGGVRDEGFEAR
ncbi:MAG TPA: NAD(P)-dependent oxidoreductase [Ktedonobacteraceae bacterium]